MIFIKKEELQELFKNGIEKGHKYLIIVDDTFDYLGDSGYHVYANNSDEFQNKINEINGIGMQKIMEIYDLSMDMGTQWNEKRAWHPPNNISI